jgi:hypothetical protein
MSEVPVRISRKDGSFIARPAKVHLHPGDTFVLTNNTNQPLVFRLDSRVPFGSQPRLAEIGKGKTMRRRARRPSWTGHKEFAYQILMIESGRKARGNSDPVIVIDNP